MNQLAERFVEIVKQWDGIQAEPHRFGGTEFKLGNVEIGHIHHNNGMVDIPFTVKIREALVTEGLAEHHHLLHDSGWITFFMRDEVGFERAVWLMRLSYLQKHSRRKDVDADTLTSLKLSDSLKAAAFPRLA